ncbi:MAG: hypothetical protein O3A46_15910, partial [Candidatus Poribacteria bacterium]|nr:hypothetical protein [Candidatus Poribacteria bacterium]
LYGPKGIAAPRPAVVFVHGHADNGKSYANYQRVCTDLANNGFVVLAVDPPGQGERFQYFADGERKIGGCTTEHTHAGQQFNLTGASIARHFIWDSMRGIDYLETRGEVDAARIGLTGNSGGGTQSVFLMMSEPRISVAIPCTFVMTLESYFKTGQPQDSEQVVPGCFVHGPDHDDYITAMAPKPVLVGAVAYDFFPLEGTEEAVERAKRVYELYGAAERVDLVVAPSRHEYAPQLREAAVNWFRKHLMDAEPTFKTGDPEVLPDEALWATPKGQLLDLYPDARTLYDLNLERFASQPRLSARSANEMRDFIRWGLAISGDRSAKIRPRILAEREVDGYPCEKVFYFSEADICVTGVLAHPKGATKRTDVVLFEDGTNGMEARREWMKSRLDAGIALFVFDPRGTGALESRLVGRSGADPHGHRYRLACDAMMLDRTTLGFRVFDVLRAYDYLATREDVEQIGLYGFGRMAFDALFAGALESGFRLVEVEELLISYRNLIETEYYDRAKFNADVLPFGILSKLDLNELDLCFEGRELVRTRPVDATGKVIA